MAWDGGTVTGFTAPAPVGNTGHADASSVMAMSSMAMSPLKLWPRTPSNTICKVGTDRQEYKARKKERDENGGVTTNTSRQRNWFDTLRNGSWFGVLHRVIDALDRHRVIDALDRHQVMDALDRHRVMDALDRHRVMDALDIHRVMDALWEVGKVRQKP